MASIAGQPPGAPLLALGNHSPLARIIAAIRSGGKSFCQSFCQCVRLNSTRRRPGIGAGANCRKSGRGGRCHYQDWRQRGELESSLQEFGEFLLKAQLVRPAAAPYFVRWVRRFLSRPASDEPLADQVRGFCEELERNGGSEDWQVRQADQALRIYFVNFLKRTDWHRRPASTVVDEQGRTSPLAALEQLRTRLRTRHYSYRTECTYVDWVRRFLDYAAQ